MKFVIFGLTVSSSWGNGHATLWRGLCRALAERDHQVVFFEHDMPYYRAARDLFELPNGHLLLYQTFAEILPRAEAELESADVAIVTSYCPDGREASDLVLAQPRCTRVFYDMDTPVTLKEIAVGQRPPYLSERGLGEFDLVLSFTGGRALDLLRQRLGAKAVATLYGHVDPLLHHPVSPLSEYRGALSYLGTYAADRQQGVEQLFLAPARALPESRFVLGGSMYPEAEKLPENVAHFPHVEPAQHPAFFCSSPYTLNVTRSSMAELGYCPSGRLFEAAASGAALLSDWFEGLDVFFEPEREICIVRSEEDVRRALARPASEQRLQAELAKRRVLSEHTAGHRAEQLERLLSSGVGVHNQAPPQRLTGS